MAALVEILVGEDADELVVELAALGHRKGRIAGLADDLDDFGDGLVGGQGQDIGLEAGLEALDLADLGALLLGRLADRQDADAAELGQGDGHIAAGYGLHRGADKGRVQIEKIVALAAEAGFERYVGGVALGRRVPWQDAKLFEAMRRGAKNLGHSRPLECCRQGRDIKLKKIGIEFILSIRPGVLYS